MTEGDRTIKHAIPVLLIVLAVSGCAAAAADLSDAARDAFRKSVPERGVIRITLQAASTTGVGTTVRAFDFASGAWYSSGGTVGTGGRRADGTIFSGHPEPTVNITFCYWLRDVSQREFWRIVSILFF